MSDHALVFGTSGILGWGVVDQILKNYPKGGTYKKVTALSHRPLGLQNASWPTPGPGTPELSILDGVDLTQGTVEELKEASKQRLPDVATVTHVSYFAYIYDPDFPTKSETNVGMLIRGLGAIESLAPNLQYVVLPTETKKGKGWKFADVICGPVVGLVPHSSHYNFVCNYMNFLSVYKFMHEQGHPAAASKQVPFPGPQPSYHTVFNDGSQDTVARFSIHLCLHQDAAGNSERYNIGDLSRPASMAERWPFICSLYGLEGVPPVAKTDTAYRLPVSFVEGHQDVAEKLQSERGVSLQGTSIGALLERWMERFTVNLDQCLDKARATGFADDVPYEEVWKTMLDRYAAAGKAYYGR